MRIGCLQFAPQVGDVDNNLNRADSVLSKANPEDLDLLVLPEMAFTGYNFRSLQDISPFLEPSGSGITSLWARTIALKYNCYVLAGYPEKVDVSPKWPTGPEYYNSAIVVNGDGETVANYRKSFLYYTDETWALEGDKGFYDGYLPGLGNTSIGICMDLNPYKFEAPWDAFEFAFHVLEVESNLVIVSMAWMTRDDPRPFSRMPNEPDIESLTYWITRLEPLIRSNNQDEIIVVFCNRTGNEGEATYSGTSAVVGIYDGEVKVYGLLGRGEKELLVVDTKNPPHAKMVYRPEADGSGRSAGQLERSPRNQHAGLGHSLPDKKSDTASKEIKKGGENSASGNKDINGSRKESRSNRKLNRSKSQEHGSRSRSPTVKAMGLQSVDVLPPLASPPSNLREPSKRRQAPTITIPTRPKLNGQSELSKSPGADTFNIPTPSAPSPTPMAVRPKLIIPASSSSKPYQYTAEQPISAASEMSERSVQSVRSNESELSTQTIRSNPRPPEDSTPYPRSGALLSGYPSNAFQSPKRIYGGRVSISCREDFTPITPFDDISPVSPRLFWRPPDTMSRTPVNGGLWQPGTLIGRKPEPFPWSDIKPELAWWNDQGEDRHRPEDGFTSRGNRKVHSSSPELNASINQTAKSGRVSGNHRTPHDPSVSARQSPPKLRGFGPTMANSTLNPMQNSADIPSDTCQRLEKLAQRLGATPCELAGGKPSPGRPSLPKSRNCSRSRSSDAADFPHDQTVHIVASPSRLSDGGHPSSVVQARLSSILQHPTSQLAHQRSNSFTSLVPERTGTPNSENPAARPPSRTLSRGRQPGPKGLPAKAGPAGLQPVRAPSVDSVVAAAYYKQFRNVSSQSQATPRDRRVSRGKGYRRRSSQGPDLSQFERVEAIVCPNCPVHGRSASADQSNNRMPLPHSNESGSLPVDRLTDEQTAVAAVPRPPALPASAPPGSSAWSKPGQTNTSKREPDVTTSDMKQDATESKQHRIVPPEDEEVHRPNDIATTGIVTKSQSSPRTPSLFNPFNPTTPRAMLFNPAETLTWIHTR